MLKPPPREREPASPATKKLQLAFKSAGLAAALQKAQNAQNAPGNRKGSAAAAVVSPPASLARAPAGAAEEGDEATQPVVLAPPAPADAEVRAADVEAS